MKIVFMGTPEFAVPSFLRLLEDGYDVAGVFTQPDKPKGRGNKLAAPPVKEAALEKGIPVFQPDRMKDGAALQLIKELRPDLIVVVAYGKILPKEILDFPPLGCINVHGSLLPKYRGAGPIQWSVLNGETVTGITTMYMAEGLDTGDMILKTEVEIGPEETSGELHDRMAAVGAQCLSDTIRLILQGNAPRIPQEDSAASYAPMLRKEMARIDFSKTADQVHNLIRGMSPWPVAFTRYGAKMLKVHRAKIASGHGQPGTVLDSERLIVACGEGAVEFMEVQLEGAKRMQVSDFLRGHPVTVGKNFTQD